MITEDLIAYIQAQTRKNTSQEIIKSRLLGAGWHLDDVEEAFRKLTPPKVAPIVASPVAQVREPERIIFEPKPIVPIRITPKEIENPIIIEKKEELKVEVAPAVQAPMAKPIFSTSFSEANPKPVFTPRVDPVITPTTKVEEPKVVPTMTLEVRDEELMPALKPKTPPVSVPVFTPTIEKVAPISTPPPIATVIAPTPALTPVAPVTPTPSAQSAIPTSLAEMKMTSTSVSDNPESNIPNGAILHSYKRALMSANIVEQHSSNGTMKKTLKILFIVLIISILGGAVFAFVGKYIPTPTLSFIKKDPKTLLVTTPITLNELKAYKTETTAVISLPPLSNITNGLISGQSVTTTDKDTFSLGAIGIVNHDIESTPVFDYNAIFKSSLFNNPLKVDLKYNNLASLVTTPDLTELLGSNSPKVANVVVSKGQFDAFIALLPDSLQSKAEKINIDKLFSVGIPSYIDDETSSIFKDFVNSATVVEKEPESIKGILSYHYELSANQDFTKKFISEFINAFTESVTDEEKALLSQRLGAVSVDSFEVWVGKEDGKIHQYRIAIKSPLSRLIGLDDSGIAGSMVTLDWKTTYYDFNVHNEIEIPTEVIPVSEYMKQVSDMKIKDKISSFGVLAQSFKNALGNYGTRSNQTGSCTNPNPSSLFSPVGHAKGGSVAVGNIASLMNDILSTTGGALACYSTSKEWALSAPLPSDPATSFCADSTGATKILPTSITGPSCK